MKNKKILKIIVLIVVIAIIGIVVFFLTKSNNENSIIAKQTDKEQSNSSSISKVEDNTSNTKEQEITMEDKVTIENHCEFNILGTKFAKDIVPSNPTGYYTYLQGKDDSQRYFELSMNVKNLNTSAVKQDSLITVKIKYDNNYEYICGLATEDASGNDLETFPNLYNIEPLKSLKYRFVVEVPSEIETDGKPLQAIITAKGNTYLYNVR